MFLEKLNKILLYIEELRKIKDIYEQAIKDRLNKSLSLYSKDLERAKNEVSKGNKENIIKTLGEK